MFKIDLDSILVIIGLVVAIFELRQNRKSNELVIALSFKEKYDTLNESRKEFYSYYQDKNFNLVKLKNEEPEMYDKIIHWESRYFWYIFNQWLQGHIRKSVPSYLRREWDYIIRSSMKNKVHQQSWKESTSKIDFLGYQEFNKYIDEAIEKGKNARL